MILTLEMCGRVVLRVHLIISWCKKVFFSRTTDCAFLNVLYEGQLFRKFMEEVWQDILGKTRLLLLCKKTFPGLSWLMMLSVL
jgi:hypothetical protein